MDTRAARNITRWHGRTRVAVPLAILAASLGVWSERATLTRFTGDLYDGAERGARRLPVTLAKWKDSRHTLRVLDQTIPITQLCTRRWGWSPEDQACLDSLDPGLMHATVLPVLLTDLARREKLQWMRSLLRRRPGHAH